MAFVYDELELYIWPEPMVFEAHIDGTIDAGERVIPYVLEGGAWAAVLPGMTLVAIGCGPMGQNLRIRVKAIDANNVTVAENGVYWLPNSTIRVLKFFEPWSVVPRITVASGVATFFSDYDVAYSDQFENPDPVVVMGPNHAGPVDDVVQFSGLGSWSPGSATISTTVFGWESGVVVGSDLIRFNTPGSWLAWCAVTDSAGKVFTGYRHIFIGEPKRNWGITQFEGSRDTGGYTIKCWTTENWTDLHGGALIMLRWKRPVSGARPYTAFVGYVQENSIKFDYQKERTEFTAISLSLVMQKLDVFGSSLNDKPAGPYSWTDMQNMTINSATVAHLRWKTTVLQIADFTPMVATYPIQAANFARGGGLSPVRDFLKNACRGDMICDVQGKLWCERDENTLAVASRQATSFIVERHDWRAEPQVDDAAIPDVSYMEVGGVVWSGPTGTVGAYLSSVPGPLPDRFGTSDTVEGLALPAANPQAWLNEIAGFIYADRINEFKRIQIPIAGRWTKSDITPQQWALTSGFRTLGTKRIQVSRVRHTYDARQRHVLSDLEAFAETWGPPGFSKQIPVVPPETEPPIYIPPILIPPPEPPLEYDVAVTITPGHIGRSLDFYTADPPTNVTWKSIPNGLPAGCAMYNIQIGGAEGWLIVNDAGSYDLYYCNDLTATSPSWSLVLTEAQARAYFNVWSGHHSQAMAVTSGGVCYLAATLQNYSATISYWRCVGGTVAGFESVLSSHAGSAGTNAGPAGAACDDGSTVYFPSEHIVPNQTIWIRPTDGGFGIATGGLSGFYAISSGHGVIGGGNMYDLASGFVRAGAFNFGQVAEMGGHTFWIRDADGFLMIDDAVQAVPNDADGGVGTFSTAGATGSAFYAFGAAGYGEILWVARSGAGSNSKCSIAYTSNGGGLWEKRDGNWAAVCGAWESGNYNMIKTSHAVLP